jgi:hypothetical protein
MVTLVIGGIVASAIVSVLRRQQRFFTTSAVLVQQRISLRDATGILPGELRALSPAGGDLLAFSDSALEIRATVGTAIVCDAMSGATAIALAPSRSSGVAPLSSFTTSPQPGDIALVFAAREPEGSTDDRWLALEITGVSATTDVCATSPFVAPPDAAAPRLVLRITGADTASIRPGAFVRILRRVRYRFYRASTSEWYLGYAEWAGTAFSGVQPVSGPFASYSRRGGSGLSLRYFDDLGVELVASSDAPRVARIDVAVRGTGRSSLAIPALFVIDSQAVGVRVRNR